MSDIENQVDKFGMFIIRNMRDRGIGYYDKLVQGFWKVPSLQSLQEELKQFDDKQLSVIRQCIGTSLDTAVHDFLFALQESSDLRLGVEIIVDGVKIAELSDGLHGEPYGQEGWYAKYSAYGEGFE